MKKAITLATMCLVTFSVGGCEVLEKARAKRDADPAEYEALDMNRHYHSHDRKDWLEGS